jgi:nucleotide-binding universal stress UspA family protein
MYRSLLVPLDRSLFAEQALPLALNIARRAGARLDLVAVHALYALEDPHAGWCAFDHDGDAECKRQEQHYLDASAKRVTAVAPVPVTAEVLSGSNVLQETVAESLLERARVSKTDLIVMATHGRAPLSRIALGSVADELIHRATVPILLVRPSEATPDFLREPVLDNILIPLDGSPLAQPALGPALDLACLMQARCTLLRVVEPHSTHHEGANGLPEKAEAEIYLRRIAARLREHGLQVRTRLVAARHVAEAILEEAEVQESNVIALATHGRSRIHRLLLGSVADKLVRLAACPLLVYRPTSLAEARGVAEAVRSTYQARRGS